MADLTPFGYTPTESLAYQALLELGPSSGYAVARHLNVARANAYQALDGLVSKGAAVVVAPETPKRYRAIQPQTVFARVLAAQSQRLDDLERDLGADPAPTPDALVPIRGERAVRDVAIRAIVRARGGVRCVAPGSELRAFAQAIRARLTSGRPTAVWTADDDREGVPGVPAAVGRGIERLGQRVILLVADGALAARLDPIPEGVWSADQLFAGLVGAAIDNVGGRLD